MTLKATQSGQNGAPATPNANAKDINGAIPRVAQHLAPLSRKQKHAQVAAVNLIFLKIQFFIE